MGTKSFNAYSINVNSRKCRRCSYCIQICPAKAIKLEKSRITIIPERCLMCGSCITECPQHALAHEGALPEVQRLLAEKKKTIACLDPAFPASLDTITPGQLVTALKHAGFTEVWEGAFGAELISQAYRKIVQEETDKLLISSVCPVIVFYIQKYLPQLIPNIAPIVSPMIATGRVARKIKGPEWKVVYITPCLAQTKEMNAPEVAGVIDQVINFHDLQKLISDTGIDPAGLQETAFDGPKPFLGRVISVIGGLNRCMGINMDVLMDEVSLTYGHKRAIGALNKVASGSIQVKFLDSVYCFGCVDGPFTTHELSVFSRRHKIARFAKAEMDKQDVGAVIAELDSHGDVDLSRGFIDMEQRFPVPTEEQIRGVLKKIDKLPPNHNLDCRACGYPTCRDKAIAVVQGISEADYCLPYLLEESKRIYQQLEKSHRELQLSHQELEQAQFQLVRTEKLAALGQLAAGVAHEINNPLGTITIYAHLLLKGLDADDPRREDVELIISESSRTKEIVQGLLSFARETKLRPGPTNVNEILEDVLLLVTNRSLFHNIRIRKQFLESLPTIHADGMQLKQVFLNIILNAAQAMEGKGTLLITTTRGKDEIKVRIQDSGPGIPPEIMGKLFSPFFTTKEKGTGLGLAISYGIIERHSGTIDIETILGKGSTFIISLPVATDGKGQEEGTKTG
ncbi:MAG: histidine kinase [Syntrophus sp. (in: bacteria)]|nr:histidine kinase [Syntrophus sp. (in: bacteria)]